MSQIYPTISKNSIKRKSPGNSRKNYPEVFNTSIRILYFFLQRFTDVLPAYTANLRQASARRVLMLRYVICSCSLWTYLFVIIIYSFSYLSSVFYLSDFSIYHALQKWKLNSLQFSAFLIYLTLFGRKSLILRTSTQHFRLQKYINCFNLANISIDFCNLLTLFNNSIRYKFYFHSNI